MEESEVQASSLQCCVGWLHPWTQVTALVRSLAPHDYAPSSPRFW